MKLGIIQRVEIYDENNDTIWFVQKHVRNVNFKKLKERDFKIARALIEVGFAIQDEKLFDLELKQLLKEVGKLRKSGSNPS